MQGYFCANRVCQYFSLFLCVFLMLPLALWISTPSSVYAAACQTNEAPTTSLSIDSSADGILVCGTGRGTVLYDYASTDQKNLPVASKLMTVVIALDTLPLDSEITISTEVEEVDSQSDYSLYLDVGEKCTVKYLIAAILYQDSDAAALAIAEYISSNEEAFVERMNEMAASLNMNNTLFANTSGADPQTQTIKKSTDNLQIQTVKQYSTAADVSALFRYALNNSDFRSIFTSSRTMDFLSDGTTMIISSSDISIWGISTLVQGAASFSDPSDDANACYLVLACKDNFETAIVMSHVESEEIYTDIYEVITQIYSYYEMTNLVSAGDIYRDVTIDGIETKIPAVFSNTVQYIHPKGDAYLMSDTTFIPSEVLSLPIQSGELLGQVVFELYDGTKIVADVNAKTDVWAQTTFLSETVSLLNKNRNVTILIGISFVIFLLAAIRSIYLRLHLARQNKKKKQA